MTKRAKAAVTLLILLACGLSGCVVSEREEVVVREPFHAPGAWVPGHYNGWGYWVPGHWR